MMGRLGAALVAGLAIAASALGAVSDLASDTRLIGLSTPTRYRNRTAGRARPAGSKLARKARRGRVGLSTIR